MQNLDCKQGWSTLTYRNDENHCLLLAGELFTGVGEGRISDGYEFKPGRRVCVGSDLSQSQSYVPTARVTCDDTSNSSFFSFLSLFSKN